jgi:hypothetical protein
MMSIGQKRVMPDWNRLKPTKAVNHSQDIWVMSTLPEKCASASDSMMKNPAMMRTRRSTVMIKLLFY